MIEIGSWFQMGMTECSWTDLQEEHSETDGDARWIVV